MTTATKESKPKKTKKKPDDPPAAETQDVETAGTRDSTDSREALAYELTKAMEACWFTASVGELLELDDDDWVAELKTIIEGINADTAKLSTGEAIPEDKRECLKWGSYDRLLAFHSPTADQCETAKSDGAAAKSAGRTLDHNPYPPETALSVYWREAFKSFTPDETAETKPPVAETKPVQPEPLTTANAAELAAKREADAKADRLRQQQLAIEAAQHEMEEAVTHQEELAEQIIDAKADLKELKASYDAAVTRGQKAAKALRRARAGQFERTLPFPKDGKSTTLEVPDQDIGSQGKPTRPSEPARDEGAFVSLDHFVKGDLQEFIPGTGTDIGISEKQAELLRDKVGGTGSVGDLEKFMRDHGEWWHKQIDGIGPETRGKIEDALAVVRKKFPMPSPDDTPAESNVEVAAEEVIEPMTPEVAKERLEELIEDCKEISENHWQDSACDWGNDVGPKATLMLNNITEHGSVTLPQAKAIRGWMAGADKCLENIDDEPDDENDPFGDDIDVPDEDGDDE